MNGTNDKQRQIQNCFSPGGGSAVKAVTKVEHQHHVPRLTGRCLRVDVPLWRTKKLHFWNSIRVIWYTPFGNILLKKSVKVNYWIHYHVWRSSNFSCFDAFVRTFINLWKFKKRVSEGEFPLRSFWGGVSPFRIGKNCNFQTQLDVYLLSTFYWKPLVIFNKILAIFMSIPPTFLVLMPLLGIINFWTLTKGGTSPRSWKNAIFKLNWQNLVISFANILLKIHYSFPMKYWL